MPTGPGQPGTVAGVMTPTDTGCLLDNYAEDVLEVLEELDHEYMPVVDSFARRQPLGIVRRADLRRLVSARRPAFVSAALTAAVPVVTDGARLDRLSARVVDSPIVLVVDQAGALAGYVEVAAILPYLVQADPPDASDEDA